MSLLAAHAICCVLVAIDLVTRALRFQWLLAGLRTPVSFRDAFVMTTVGDAAAAVTPNRVGAEPARLAAAAFAGVPVTAAVVAVTIEIICTIPVTVGAAGWLALIYAPRWWHSAKPLLAETASRTWPWIVVLIAAGLVAWIVVRRALPKASTEVKRGTRRAWAYARRMPAWPLIASVPLTFIGLAARVAILPVLALTLPFPPPMGPLTFGSFALLYAQVLVPTPSGAGVIDLGFVGGAVGDLGEHHRRLLFIWRMYTTAAVVGIGALVALRVYGAAAVAALVRRREESGGR
ncbi:MAG TPA: lysylphosphatidylglycerol synthase domain-containing protein [Gemmatimonadaceae bacterium]|nr:lysylphosphatidylglycerol synthase domain-containing protein [Gemmatimonadaceae bacterium]